MKLVRNVKRTIIHKGGKMMKGDACKRNKETRKFIFFNFNEKPKIVISYNTCDIRYDEKTFKTKLQEKRKCMKNF